jgi:hypothetical protein
MPALKIIGAALILLGVGLEFALARRVKASAGQVD